MGVKLSEGMEENGEENPPRNLWVKLDTESS